MPYKTFEELYADNSDMMDLELSVRDNIKLNELKNKLLREETECKSAMALQEDGGDTDNDTYKYNEIKVAVCEDIIKVIESVIARKYMPPFVDYNLQTSIHKIKDEFINYVFPPQEITPENDTEIAKYKQRFNERIEGILNYLLNMGYNIKVDRTEIV